MDTRKLEQRDGGGYVYRKLEQREVRNEDPYPESLNKDSRRVFTESLNKEEERVYRKLEQRGGTCLQKA